MIFHIMCCYLSFQRYIYYYYSLHCVCLLVAGCQGRWLWICSPTNFRYRLFIIRWSHFLQISSFFETVEISFASSRTPYDINQSRSLVYRHRILYSTPLCNIFHLSSAAVYHRFCKIINTNQVHLHQPKPAPSSYLQPKQHNNYTLIPAHRRHSIGIVSIQHILKFIRGSLSQLLQNHIYQIGASKYNKTSS